MWEEYKGNRLIRRVDHQSKEKLKECNKYRTGGRKERETTDGAACKIWTVLGDGERNFKSCRN